MKNLRNLLLLFWIINFIKCDSLCSGSSNSINDCKDLLSDIEISDGYHCCFFSGTKDDGEDDTQCTLLDNNAYNNLEDTKSQKKNEGHYSDVDIDCNSVFNKLSFFLIFLLNIFSL